MGRGHHSPHCPLCQGLAPSSPPDPPLLSVEEKGEHARQGSQGDACLRLKCLCSGLTSGVEVREALVSSNSRPTSELYTVTSQPPASLPHTLPRAPWLVAIRSGLLGLLKDIWKVTAPGLSDHLSLSLRQACDAHISPGCSSSGNGLRRCGRSGPGRSCPRLGLL